MGRSLFLENNARLERKRKKGKTGWPRRWSAERFAPASRLTDNPASCFGFLARLHFVADRLLGGRDHFDGAALGLDLVGGRLREVVRLDDQLLGDVAGAEDAHAVRGALGEADLLEGFCVDGFAVLEGLVEVADVDDVVL